MLTFGLLCITSLFTVVNPLGVMPIYISMTSQLTRSQAKRTALKATIVAAITLTLFALTGQLIFNFFNISVDSLRIVGGVLFFGLGYEMLQAHLTRSPTKDETITEYVDDVSITPLAIPMIAGPGAITVVILLMQDAASLPRQGLLFAAILIVMAVTYLLLISARRVMHVLGEDGNKVLMRLMGLIVMVIAVEFFFAGLTPILRRILMLEG